MIVIIFYYLRNAELLDVYLHNDYGMYTIVYIMLNVIQMN
jgi:hypothetical protein